jgi:predicted ATPase
MLRTLAVPNYRSVPNDSGKSNVYRALRLLAETACGGLIASLAREGGFASTLWAGGPEPFSEWQALPLRFRGSFASFNLEGRLPIRSTTHDRERALKAKPLMSSPSRQGLTKRSRSATPRW